MTTVPEQRLHIDLRELEAAALAEPGPAVAPGGTAGGTASWLRRYVVVLVLLDASAVLVAGAVATHRRFGTLHQPLEGSTYLAWVTAASLAWVATMASCRAYEGRFLGIGSEEFRRVFNGAVRFTALVAVVTFALHVDPARGMVGRALPAAGLLTLALRYGARRVLHRVRARGAACHRVILLGEGPAAQALERRMATSPYAGLQVVHRCGLDVARSPARLRSAIAACGADTVAVAHAAGVDPELLRRLSWALETTGVDLLVAPAFTDVAGPRIHVRPVSGLPLLQIAAPEISGGRRLVKRAIDVLVSLVLLLLLAPVLLVVAALVRLTSPGPALFRQERVGRDGEPFQMYKFRSMCADAEQRRDDLLAANEAAGVLFKLRGDPRVTPLGRWLRRWSVDELPQLVNVVRGDMSLVGPRPPLPGEVARYERHVHRRLLVAPGLTGLWQVSGRSDLSWEETVRLDLYYVENWSVALDAEIVWKTAFAVLRGRGAR